MSATAATAKMQKPLKRHPSKLKQASAYTNRLLPRHTFLNHEVITQHITMI